MTDSQQINLVKIWMLASQNENRLVFDSRSIGKQLGANSRISLQFFIDKKWLEIIKVTPENASKMIAPNKDKQYKQYKEYKQEKHITLLSSDSVKQKSERLNKINYKFLPEDMRFVEKMRTDILEFDSKHKFKGSKESWANDIRKLREIDNRDITEIEALWSQIQEDPFWQKNILSASKLRQQFSHLTIKLEDTSNPFEQARKEMERKKQ